MLRCRSTFVYVLESRDQAVEYKDPSEKYTIIIGYLIKNEGVRIQPSKFNKLANSLGLDKQNKEGIQDLLNDIQSDESLTEIYKLAVSGDISVEDLSYGDTEDDKPLADPDAIPQTMATYVKDNEITKAQMREFRRFQQDEAHLEILLEHFYRDELGAVLSQLPESLKKSRKIRVADEQGEHRKLGLFPSDWHIGALVNVHNGNKYNYSIFKSRLDEYIEDVLDRVSLFKPQSIGIYHLGDLIEHINMRNVDQPFFTEFPASKQVALATGALLYLVERLYETNLPIDLGIIAGNHSRINGNKKDNVHGDTFDYIILDTLLRIKEAGGLSGVTILDNSKDIYKLAPTVFGKQILCVHGDKLPSGKKKIPSFVKDHSIDYLFYGHYHTWDVAQEDYARFRFMCPSIMGYNNYSEDANLPSSSPSQAMVLFEENKAPIIIPSFFTK